MKVDRQRVNGVKVNSFICPSAESELTLGSMKVERQHVDC